MPFLATDKFKVVRHLAIPLASSEIALSAISDEAIISEIQSVIAELDAVRLALSSERSSANNALIRADVLEWSENRASGMESERLELLHQLATLLNVEWGYSCPNLSGSMEYMPYG